MKYILKTKYATIVTLAIVLFLSLNLIMVQAATPSKTVPKITLKVTRLDFNNGYWNYQITWTLQNLNNGSIKVNKRIFVNNITQSGTDFTGYSLKPKESYTFVFYSKSNGMGKILATTKVVPPRAISSTVSKPNLIPISLASDPIPKNLSCLYRANRYKQGCDIYYNSQTDQLVCPQYYNPVYGSDGLFYPSACWAKAFGITRYSFGYSPSLVKLFSDQWNKEGIKAPRPDIEFTYQGSGLLDFKSGMWLRSSYWKDAGHYSVIDFNIGTDREQSGFTKKTDYTTMLPVMGYMPKVVVVYLTFDDAFPSSVLTDLTSVYGKLMNEKLRKKQKVPNPIQLTFSSVILSPSKIEMIKSAPTAEGVPVSTTQGNSSKVNPLSFPDHIYFTENEVQSVYQNATQTLNDNNYDIVVIVPVQINGFGGYYAPWSKEFKELIVAPLIPPAPYSTVDKKQGINAVAAFQQMFATIDHEVLHSVGLPGDHMPMSYGVTFLTPTVGALITDPITGESKQESETRCDFLGTSPDYSAVALPLELQFKVGEKLSSTWPENSASGNCLSGLYNNEILKDYNKDGIYEMMYSGNLVGKELQRFLGWIDVDGDGVAELVDQTPYGNK